MDRAYSWSYFDHSQNRSVSDLRFFTESTDAMENDFTSFRKQIDPFLHLLLCQRKRSCFLSGLAPPGPGVLPFLPVVPKLPVLQWVPNGKESSSRYIIYGGWVYHSAMYSHQRLHVILFLKYFIFLRGKENLFGLVWFGFPESPVSQLPFLGSVLMVRHIFTATVLGL